MLAMQQEDGIIGGWHGDGNFARTAIMFALWKQQGVTVQPWRQDLRVGAVQEDGVLKIQLTGDKAWKGRLVFDQPRHKAFMHLPLDYPRINQFPEWFTVDKDATYQITNSAGSATSSAGQQLIDGLSVDLTAGDTVEWTVKQVTPPSRQKNEQLDWQNQSFCPRPFCLHRPLPTESITIRLK
jgi:hypothetical protein